MLLAYGLKPVPTLRPDASNAAYGNVDMALKVMLNSGRSGRGHKAHFTISTFIAEGVHRGAGDAAATYCSDALITG